MRTARLMVLALVVLPQVVTGQVGRTGQIGQTRRAPSPSSGKRPPTPSELNAGNLGRTNPAKLIEDRRKDLGLTDDQMKRLDSIARAYDGEAKRFAKAVDTLRAGTVSRIRRDPRGAAPPPSGLSAKDSIERARKDGEDQEKSDKDAIRMMAARNGLDSKLLEMRAWQDSSIARTVRVLTDDQRAKTEELLQWAAEDLTTMLHWANAAPVGRGGR